VVAFEPRPNDRRADWEADADMPSPPDDRQPWEYADGPEVGREVPITAAPREEEAPGIPAPPQANGGENGGQRGQNGRAAGDGAEATEEREVRAADPELPSELNERLTAELREVVGADRVEVPAGRPRASQGEHPPPHTGLAYLNAHRLQLVRTLAIALTFGGVVSLITNDWWFLILAAGLHALGTMAVTFTAIRMTTIIEHPSPELGAALSEEGISSPDEYFSNLVQEFRREPERGAGEVVSSGYNERTTSAGTDTPLAGAEESSAMTPTAEPSRPGGQGGAPDILIWSTALALLALSIVFPAISGGGWMWLLTAVMVPLLAGWMVLQWLFRRRGERVQLQGGAPLTTIAVCTAIAVAAFCAVVAFAFQH
jgi:hypothetical protein